jgi:hypothetical protein
LETEWHFTRASHRCLTCPIPIPNGDFFCKTQCNCISCNFWTNNRICATWPKILLHTFLLPKGKGWKLLLSPLDVVFYKKKINSFLWRFYLMSFTMLLLGFPIGVFDIFQFFLVSLVLWTSTIMTPLPRKNCSSFILIHLGLRF